MVRRRAILKLAAPATFGLAGCLGGGSSGTATPTEQTTAPDDRAPLKYLVRNDDDTTHTLEVTVEDPEGTVVHRDADPEFEPGEQLEGTYSPPSDAGSPYPVTVALASLSTTVDWNPEECVQFDLLVAITEDGQVDVEREACIK